MEQDIGRPLQLITYNIINVDLMKMCERVASNLAPIETDVVSASGKSYFMRIAPIARPTSTSWVWCSPSWTPRRKTPAPVAPR